VRDDEKQREHERRMARRDEQARLEELEDDIAAAEKVITAIESERDKPRSQARTARGRALEHASFDPGEFRRFLGGPSLLELIHCFEGSFPRERFEQVVERLREITHEPGITEIRDHGVVWATNPERHAGQPHLVVRVTVAPDGTHTNLVVTDRLGALVGRVFGAFGTIIGAGGLAAPVAASIAFPWFSPVFVLGWLGGVLGATRVAYRRLAAGRAEQLERTFGALVLEIEPYVEKKASGPERTGHSDGARVVRR
jgi:hypothetical protein